MASTAGRVTFRVLLLLLLLFVAFYFGRPLYWKLSATIQEIREKKQTVKEGLWQTVLDARRSVGWLNDESDPGVGDERRTGKAVNRRILRSKR
ncbi:hypothetical protein H6P81_002014 [Aristolochia fimbriata]|uniref:Uncharacterized protein n=1 Tax=Aristolochia fimbriata TaxID=158543 RepID=A0AAV7F9P3_ARIFI|nr:hypothetical protein H6P81_002014 [Aristolochia fimbriata]